MNQPESCWRRYLKEVEHTEEVRHERVAKKFNRFFASDTHDDDGAFALESAINHDIELHWLSVLQLWWMGSLASAFDSAPHDVSSEACSVASGSVESSHDMDGDENQVRVNERASKPPSASVRSSLAASNVESVRSAVADTEMGLQNQVQARAASTEKQKSSIALPATPTVLLASAMGPPTLSSVATLGIAPKMSRNVAKAPTSRDYLERGTGPHGG